MAALEAGRSDKFLMTRRALRFPLHAKTLGHRWISAVTEPISNFTSASGLMSALTSRK
jgi:hypothetical protein